MVARRSFSNYEIATGADAKVVTRRIMNALERRVLNDKNVELRGYFEQIAQKTTSPLGGALAEDVAYAAAWVLLWPSRYRPAYSCWCRLHLRGRSILRPVCWPTSGARSWGRRWSSITGRVLTER